MNPSEKLPPYPVFTQTFHSSIYEAIDPRSPSLSAQGKIVLVTGGSKGVGKHIATVFSVAGAHSVVVLGRTLSDLENASKEISTASRMAGHSTAVKFFQVDISNSGAVLAVFRQIRRELGAIDVFISNAGDAYLSTIQEASVDSYWKSFEVNVKGLLNCTQAFLQVGMDHNTTSPPTLINVSTIGVAMGPMPIWSSYGASKLAAWKLVEDLGAEMGKKLRIFSIHPGRIATDMAKKTGIPTADNGGE